MEKPKKKRGRPKKGAKPTDAPVEAVSVPKGTDAAALLASAASAPKKTATKSPKLEISEPVKGIVSALRKAYTAFEEAKAAFDEKAETLKSAVSPLYRKYLAAEDYLNTVQISNGEDEVQVSYKHAYSKVPTDQGDALRAIVGGKYEELFETASKVEVRPEVLKNPVLLQELLDKVGADALTKFFNVEQFIVPTQKYTKRRFAELSDEQNAQLDAVVRQYSPSVKIR